MDAQVDESAIGETPLLELDLGVAPTVYAKVEWFNLHHLPYGGGSIKSRMVSRMLDDAEVSGDLSGQTIIEASSGNTGSELTRVGAARGYDVEVVVPVDAARGKIDAIRDAGGTIHVVPAGCGQAGQYGAHEGATGPELWRQSDGDLSHVAAGVGTGGTVTGVGRALHERGDVTLVGFEPNEDPHAIEGLRHFRGEANAHRDAYDESVLDARRYLDSETAWELRDRYADRESEFVVGPSSGAAVAIVRRLAGEWTIDGVDTVDILLCDRGD